MISFYYRGIYIHSHIGISVKKSSKNRQNILNYLGLEAIPTAELEAPPQERAIDILYHGEQACKYRVLFEF